MCWSNPQSGEQQMYGRQDGQRFYFHLLEDAPILTQFPPYKFARLRVLIVVLWPFGSLNLKNNLDKETKIDRD